MKLKRTQGRTRVRAPEHRALITQQMVREILQTVPQKPYLAAQDSKELIDLSSRLAELQQQVWHNILVKESWKPASERRAVITAALQVLLKELEPLQEELQRSISLSQNNHSFPEYNLFTGASSMIADLLSASEAVAGHWLLTGKAVPDADPVKWTDYAKWIFDSAKDIYPDITQDAIHHLISQTVPCMSGEELTQGAVKSHFVKGRPLGITKQPPL